MPMTLTRAELDRRLMYLELLAADPTATVEEARHLAGVADHSPPDPRDRGEDAELVSPSLV